MHCSIAALPFEILVNVASFLNLEDFVNLKLTRKELFETLHSESISRKAVKVRHESHAIPPQGQRPIQTLINDAATHSVLQRSSAC